MKLLFVSSDKFPPFRSDVAVLFGKKMVGRGHVIDWLLQSDETTHRPYQTEWSGCRVYVGPTDNGTTMMKRLKKHFLGIYHDFKIFRLLGGRRYDFILVRDKFISGLTAIIASKIFNVKFIYWLSYPFPEYYLYRYKDGTARYPLLYWIRGNIFKLLLYRILLPFCIHAFVQTKEMRKQIAAHNVPEGKMTPVVMGVATEEIPFFGYEKKQYEHREEKIVLYLGSLTRERNIEFLIRVFAQVLTKENAAKLYLVGSGDDFSDEQALKEEAKRLGIETSIFLTGHIPQKEAWVYAKSADVCVSPIFPSPILDCGSPTKLIEYMALGKAVVANDHPEQRLVISESKGGICVPYKEAAFSDAIVYLLKHPEEAKEMGIRGREYVEKKRDYEQLARFVEAKLTSIYKIPSLGKANVKSYTLRDMS